jgi:hypothetical protein
MESIFLCYQFSIKAKIPTFCNQVCILLGVNYLNHGYESLRLVQNPGVNNLVWQMGIFFYTFIPFYLFFSCFFNY